MNSDDNDFDPNYYPNCERLCWKGLPRHMCEDKLSVLSVNARSIGNKFSEFLSHLSEAKRKFTFIVVSETWLTESRDFSYEIDGYSSLSIYRPEGHRGGGIKIYHLNTISVTKIERYSSISGPCERLFIEAEVPTLGPLLLGAIYRPPSADIGDFCELLSDILLEIQGTKSILLGDFNLNILNPNFQANIQNYIDIFYQNSYVNEINLPTYQSPITNSDTSCLDHIWHNLSLGRKSFVVEPNISDHYATCAIFDKKIKFEPRVARFRNFSEERVGAFTRIAPTIFEDFRYSADSDVNQRASEFINFLHSILNQYFPILSKTISPKRSISPWVCGIILRCLKKKQRWYRLSRRGIISHASYKKCRSAYRKLLKIAREEYFSNKFNNLNRDMKKSWRVLNDLLGRISKRYPKHFIVHGARTTIPSVISEAFNKYFTAHPKEIHESIPDPQTDYSYLIRPNPNSFFFQPCTENEISLIIQKMKKEGSLNDIPRKFLKFCAPFICNHLCNIFNDCATHGIFPSIFKLVRISPVFKKGSVSSIQNYRPISLLSNVSKIFESLIFNRLNAFMQSQNILSDRQYGFRAGKNTELAVLDLISKLLPALNNKKFIICIFLDYSACFDTISRTKLLEKLERYGVRGYSLKLMESYFTNRLQYVEFNSAKSKKLTSEIGVIQGSRLGPLMYDIYSNDFNDFCARDENILYADDTCLVYTGENLPELVNCVNSRLVQILDWCNFNKLSLNPQKSKFMIITPRIHDIDPEIRIGNSLIERVNDFKYLGVSISCNMRYHSHISQLKTKLSRMCGISYKLGNLMNKVAAKNFYYSCVYSVLSYCICVWGGIMTCTQRCEPLARLQAKIVKNVFSRHYPNSLCLFKSVGILKLIDIYRLRVSIYMFRVMKLGEVPSLERDLEIDFPTHSHFTRNVDLPTWPTSRIETVRMNFKYQFVNIWREIPADIRASTRLRPFKNALIGHYLNSYD